MSGNRKIKINRRLGNPITGLSLSLDSSNVNSYSGSGTNWLDLTTNANNVTFVNEPVFSNANSGVLVFDGSNWGTITDNSSLEFGNGMFTMETWVKFSELRGYQGIISKQGYSDGNGFLFLLEANNTFTMYAGNGGWQVGLGGQVTPNVNEWYHVVITRNVNGEWKMWINGQDQSGNPGVNTSLEFPDNETNMYIGSYTNFPSYSNQPANNLYGSIGLVKVWKGYCMSPSIVEANYGIGSIRFSNTTTTTTTASGDGYSLILPFEGDFSDTSSNNLVATVVGNPAISSDSKLGSGSMFLENSGDGLSYASSELFNFGNADFTIESFVKFSNTDDSQAFFTNYNTWDYDAIFLGRHPGASGKVSAWFYDGSSLITLQESEITTNEWVHYALVRYNNTISLYKNGISVDSASVSSTNWNGNHVANVGFAGDNPSGYGIQGYLDSFKLSKVARYTSNFIPEKSIVLSYDMSDANSYSGSGNMIYDLSVYENDGVLSGDYTYEAINGGVIDLGGNSATIAISNTGNITPPKITLETWVKPSDISTYHELFRMESNGMPIYLFSFQLSNIISFGLNTSISGYNELDVTLDPNDVVEKWCHFVATYESGSKKLYLNGALIGEAYDEGTINFESSSPAHVGSSSGVFEFLDGKIGLFNMYNYSLTSTEVSNRYNSTKNRFKDGSIVIDGVNTSTLLMNGAQYDIATDVYTFDGDNDYAETNYVIPEGDFSFGGWAKSSTSGSWSNRLMGNADSTGGYDGVDIVWQSVGEGILWVVRRSGANGGGGDITSGVIPNLSIGWHYVVVTYNTVSGLVLYVDGEEVSSNGTVGFGSSLPFRIGRDGNGTDAFNGQVSGVFIDTVTLTATDVLNNFNSNKNNFIAWTSVSNGSDVVLNNGAQYDSGTDIYTVDGNNDYALLANAPKPTSQMTLMGWVKADLFDGGWRKAICFAYDNTSWSPPYFSYQLGAVGSSLTVGFSVDSDYNTGSVYYPNVVVNTWYHVAGTFENGIIKMYVNGQLFDTKDVSSTGTNIIYTNRTDLTIGLDAEYYIGEQWNGLISNIEIHPVVLSGAEILNKYDSTVSSHTTTTTTTTTAAPTTTTTTTAAPYFVSNGLIQNLDASKLASYSGTGNLWTDLTGNNHNGTLMNSTSYNSENGGSMVFNGSSDYVSVGQFIGTTNTFSVSHWVNLSGNQTGRTIFSNYNGSNGWVTGISDSSSNYFKFYLGAGNTLLSTYALVPNTWYYVVVTYNNGNPKIYINGVLDNTTSTAINFSGNYNYGNDISRLGSGGQTFGGKIGSIQFYNRALTDSEVLQNFDNTKSRFNLNTTTTTTVSPTTTTTTTSSGSVNLIMNLDAGNISSYPGTGTNWYDLTNTYSGISLVNGATYDSNSGGSIVLDGVNDYVSLGNIAVTPNKNKFTFNAVYKFDKSKANAIFSTGTPGSSTQDILFAHDGNVFFFQINNNADGGPVANYSYTSNTWLNVCIVYDATQANNTDKIKVYFNGVQNTLSFGSFNVPSTGPIGAPSYLGKYVCFSGWDLKGNIAIAQLYDGALTSGEVAANYDAIKNRFGI